MLGNRSRVAFVASVLLLCLHLTWVTGQTSYNEREVKSESSALDDPKLDVWSLDFRFKDPRLIKVNIPGRGTRICWYLWYQVINRSKEPRTFIPDFELVTLDNPGVYRDEVLPSVEDAIRKLEDPTGYQDIKNSVTITAKPIPVSEPAGEAFPRTVTGVAIWDGTSALDPDQPWKDNRQPGTKDISDSNRFQIFVSGLSNGWVLVDQPVKGKTDAPVIRRKTLQLNFKRVGDRFSMDSREISFVPPSEWIYRSARLRIPGLDADAGKEKDKVGALNQLPGKELLQPK